MTTSTLAAPTVDFLGLLADSVTRARTLEELVRPLLELLQTVTDLESTWRNGLSRKLQAEVPATV